LVLGGALGAVVLAVAAIVIFAGNDPPDRRPQPAPSGDGPRLPPQEETDVRAAAEKAGCDLRTAALEGAGHEQRRFTAADYRTNPPTSGAHFPTWYQDGVYAPGATPDLGQLVHTLEHGRINVQYRPGTAAATVRQLEALVAEQEGGYHMLLYENATNMPYEVAATAWTQLLGCERFSPAAIDALRTFRTAYIDKGPERVP